MPSGVVSASNTIDGRAAIRRTRVRLVIGRASSLRPSLRFGIGRQPIEAARPEALVATQPVHRFPHGFAATAAPSPSARLRPRDEPGLVEHVEMLHHRRQLDREGLRQFADRSAVLALEPRQDRPPRRVDERGEGPVELAL